MQNANKIYGELKYGFFNSANYTTNIKIKVYEGLIKAIVLYGLAQFDLTFSFQLQCGMYQCCCHIIVVEDYHSTYII